MSDDAKKVYELLMALPEAERLSIVEVVSDAVIEHNLDPDLREELRKRLQQHQEGSRPSINGEAFFAQLREKSDAGFST